MGSNNEVKLVPAPKNRPTENEGMNKQKRETGRQSEESYHELVDNVVDYGIFLLDSDGIVSTWNIGASRIKGYDAHEILGEHFSKFYTAEDNRANKPARLLDKAARLGRVEDEGWRVRKDGTKFWADVIITALYNEEGGLKGFAKVTRDLTERKNSEEELRRAYNAVESMVREMNTTNKELSEINAKLAGREYRIRELENELRLMKLRLSLTPRLTSEHGLEEEL